MTIATITVKVSSFATVSRGRIESDVIDCIEHSYEIELEGDFESPTYTMPEGLDATQQDGIKRAVQYYLDNYYDAEEAASDAAENASEDRYESIRKDGY